MFGLGPAEFIIILVFALLIFGPKRLPELGKQITQAIREFRNVSRELETQVREEFSEVLEEEGKEKGGRKKDTL